MIIVNLRENSYQVPETRDEEWGDSTSEYLVALASTINDITPSDDILDTLATGLTDDNTWRQVPLLQLNSGSIHGGKLEIFISRTGGLTIEANYSTCIVSYDDLNSTWVMSRSGSGINFGLTELRINNSTGNVEYKAATISGTSSYKMRFRFQSVPR